MFGRGDEFRVHQLTEKESQGVGRKGETQNMRREGDLERKRLGRGEREFERERARVREIGERN